MSSYSSTATELYVLFCAVNIYVLKTVNEIVWEPYMVINEYTTIRYLYTEFA